jgi:hypothetical protein
MSIAQLRRAYHRQICSEILFIKKGVPNIADVGSKASVAIASEILDLLNQKTATKALESQTAGVLFEQITKIFLEKSFQLLHHLRPGKWRFSVNQSISQFEQYEHVADLHRILKEKPELAAVLREDYLVTPDIIVGRFPVTEEEINQKNPIVDKNESLSRLTPLRAMNRPGKNCLLHASISCKWTLRSDRAQNIRTEALNLIRNRKGHTPHISAVTAEPLPTRLASLAFGTGDLDCVYHFALPELQRATERRGGVDQMAVLSGMIDGRRLRDISDLPFDLAI